MREVRTIDHPTATIVTGAAGWLGTSLVTALAGDGRHGRNGSVRGLVRSEENANHLPKTIELIRGDVTNRASLDRLFDGLGDGPIDLIPRCRGDSSDGIDERI